MYEIIKNVIDRKNYELSSILKKIDQFWVQDKLTDDEHTELTELARNGSDTAQSIDIIAKLNDLEQRIRKLETNSDSENGEEYPEYVSEKWYYNGDKCSFEGVNYTCIAPEGVVCVWSPKDYPAYWEAV